PEAPPSVPEAEAFPDVPAWESVEASRRPDRPGVGYLLRHGTTEQVLLSGTERGEADTMMLALARFDGQPASSSASSASSEGWSVRRRCGRPGAAWRWRR